MVLKPTALILAGGFATRLWPLTEKRAKPLLPLAGKPLIRHIIDKIPPEIPIIISTNQVFQDDFQGLKEHYPDRTLDVFIEDSSHDKSKKGALGATALVISSYGLKSPLLLIAGDNYFGFDMLSFLEAYQGRTLLASFDTKSLQSARQFGVLEMAQGRLVSFQEKPQDPRSTLISTGCYLFAREHLPMIEEYALHSSDNLGGIFEFLLRKKQEIEVFTFSEEWIDIGSFESYLQAHRLLCAENRISSRSELKNCQIGTSVEIAPGCTLENCSIEDSIIMEGCRLKDARIRGCIIDQHCTVEGVDLDHKMIRAGSIIKST